MSLTWDTHFFTEMYCLPHCTACLNRRRYLLTKLHPLLGGAVGLRGSTVVEARVLPHDGLWPTNQVRGACGGARGWGAGGLAVWGAVRRPQLLQRPQLPRSALCPVASGVLWQPRPAALVVCTPACPCCSHLRSSLTVALPPLLRVWCVQATVRIEPLAVEIGEIPLLRQSVGVLNTAVRWALPPARCAATRLLRCLLDAGSSA